MNQQVLTLTPGGDPLTQSLGFEARAVQVDNYTWSYLTLPDVGKTIPPWAYGVTVPLPPGIRRASAVLSSTVAVAGPPVPLAQASLTWTDQPLPVSPGHILQQSQYTRVNPTAFVTESVLASAASVKVTDVTPFSAGDQISAHKANGSGGASGAIISAVDPNTNTITVTTTIGVALDPGDTVAVLPQFFSRVNVNSAAQPVTLATATPAPWQAASSGTTIHLTTKVDPLTDTIIVGVSGKVIRLHGWSLSSDVSPNSVYLRTATLGRFAECRFINAVATDSHNWHDFKGRPMPVGEGVTISSDAAAFVSGTLDYSLDPA